MKKRIIISLLLLLFLVGCGKGYKTYTKEQKIKIIQENNEKKLKKILNELEAAAKKDDEKAIEELTEWVQVIMEK